MTRLALALPVLSFSLFAPQACSPASDASPVDEVPTEMPAAGGTTAEEPSDGTGGDPTASGGTTGFVSCPEGAILCDDFDTSLDQWTVDESGGSLTLDTAVSFGGPSSLLIDIPAGQRGGFLEFSGAPLFPLPENKMVGRAMVYFESLPDGHTDIFRGAGVDANVPWYNVGHQHGEVLLNYFESYPEVDCWARPQPGYDIPTGQWMCWEWVFDGQANQLDFYIDGQLARRVTQTGDGCVQGGNQTWEAPVFQTLLVGAYNAQTNLTPNEGRMWIDDLAVSVQERLGCPGE